MRFRYHHLRPKKVDDPGADAKRESGSSSCQGEQVDKMMAFDVVVLHKCLMLIPSVQCYGQVHLA